ncbi:SubName: Full=Uncharacterized protein {ECO:0000313/EMBL:CCA67238.1} [Serendipita indica DSM 11827]|uniref:Rdx family-domain-containing protein n=1 Tax=Serendipita indica (strain DSM 11827) TaxID=1109443 RepID=G4T7G8_SERID|nr:SubName: Full=Uncharacterized protein {ECO:0000313/EMBL:CCA67238.1} [Serendipita indica DSM 11827]CCA67238.1 hypothetical protein PIIN_01071 [Serendipita indica DSM 11827]
MSDPDKRLETCTDCDPRSASEIKVEAKSENPLDASTFEPPLAPRYPVVTIEYCDRCRWLHRATWIATELSVTFPPPQIQTISLVAAAAPLPAGRFRMWLAEAPNGAQSDPIMTLIWDRKVEDGFPDLKVVKQRIRDKVAPNMSLGHSDRK